MDDEWLDIIEQCFYKQHDRYLSDLEREILRRCHNSNQTYEMMAAELSYAPGSINFTAAELWKLLADVFEEKVTKANLCGAVNRFVQNQLELPARGTLELSRITICDRSQQEPARVEQLRRLLQEAGRETTIDENWLQLNDRELEQYSCFVLILSSHSVNESEIITEEIQRIREFRCTRSERTVKILLIHVDSYMSLPLNHPLHKELQGIPQLECNSSTEPRVLVEKIIESLKVQNKPKIPDDLVSLIQNLGKLKISDNWMLTYIGENQLHKLGDLVRDLKNRKIRTRYAYWGVGPTRMWERACSDPAYHMLENLRQFPLNAKQLAEYVNKEQYNFVSLGVGEGSKDSNIIKDFFNRDESSKPRDDFLYLPVDISLDMLRVAIGKIQELPSYRRIAIQRDLETKDGMRQIAHIANVLGKNQPILYGFIGNTIANVEDPERVLDNIVRVMKPEDLLLFEAQIIDDSALKADRLSETIRSVKEEYEGISFRQFALSALLQNSDLSVEPKEKDSCYLVEGSLQSWNYGQVLRIDCWFKNNTDRELYLTFSNEDTTTLNKEEKISLYRSQKFTPTTLENFVQTMNLNILKTSTYLREKGTGFIVMMLQKQK